MDKKNQEKKENFISDFLLEINKFRVKPTSIEKKLDTFKLGLSRFKNKQNIEFIGEIEKFGKTLSSLKKMPQFRLNDDLSDAANKEIFNVPFGKKYQHFIKGDTLKGKIPDKYLDQNCLMIIDDGVDSPESFLLKMLMDRMDKDKLGRKYLLDSKYTELGIGLITGPDNDFNIIVVFCQFYVEDKKVELPDYDLGELKRAFDLFDVNKIEKIDPKETTKAMNLIGFDKKNPELYKILQELESKGDLIDFPTFAWHICGKISDRESKEGLQTIFNLFIDDWEDETISIFALKRIVKELDDKEAQQEVDRLLNYKGAASMKLDFDQFYEFMTKVWKGDDKAKEKTPSK